jgi:hypothetical protein
MTVFGSMRAIGEPFEQVPRRLMTKASKLLLSQREELEGFAGSTHGVLQLVQRGTKDGLLGAGEVHAVTFDLLIPSSFGCRQAFTRTRGQKRGGPGHLKLY